MKKGLPFIVLVIGILNHLPLFLDIGFLSDLYYSTVPRLIIQFLMLIILLYLFFKYKSKLSVFLFAILLIISILNNQLNKIENILIIELNSNKTDISSFTNPFLGYKIFNNHNCKNCIGNVSFIYNKGFGSFDALIYQPNHSLKMDDMDKDASVKQVYNKNWWKYEHID